jgi:hypothetical protein
MCLATSKPEQIADLEKKAVVCTSQVTESQPFRFREKAAVAGEAHDARRRLIRAHRRGSDCARTPLLAHRVLSRRRESGSAAGARVVAKRVLFAGVVFADDAEENRPRHLVFRLQPRNLPDADRRAVTAPLVGLKLVLRVEAQRVVPSTRAPSAWFRSGLTAKTSACRLSLNGFRKIRIESSASMRSRLATVACTVPGAACALTPK